MKVVILGDSLSTGAATHPSLVYDTKMLLDLFLSGQRPEASTTDISPFLPSQAPIELTKIKTFWPDIQEFAGGLDWMLKNINLALARHYLNTEEYSWGAILSSYLGQGGQELAIAAENGSRIDAAYNQAFRAKDALKEADYLFVFFTGNDLCAPNNDFLSLNLSDYSQTFKKNILRISRLLEGRSRPIKIVFPGFLQLQQLMSRDEILDKKVTAFGQNVSCRDLREAGFVAGDKKRKDKENPYLLEYLLPPNPAFLCPTIFGSLAKNSDQVTYIANKVRFIRGEQQRIIKEVETNEAEFLQKNQVTLHYLNATENLLFNGEEISEDCFHLSIAGQAKLARVIFEELSEIER